MHAAVSPAVDAACEVVLVETVTVVTVVTVVSVVAAMLIVVVGRSFVRGSRAMGLSAVASCCGRPLHLRVRQHPLPMIACVLARHDPSCRRSELRGRGLGRRRHRDDQCEDAGYVHGVSSGTSRGEMMAAIRHASTHCSFGTGLRATCEETMTLVRPRASLPCRIRCPRIGVPCPIGRVVSSLVSFRQLMVSALLVPVTTMPLTVASATMKYEEFDFLSILHPAKVATPLDVETGLAVHVRFPELPPVNRSVTGDTGAVVRTLPPASTILITGCVTKTAASRLFDGCVVNDSAAAGPTLMLNGLLTVVTKPTVAVKV